jgi:hypothetical protein
MIQSYSTLTKAEINHEITAIRKTARQINSSPAQARKFLISIGIATRDGKRLAKRYR